MRQRIVQRQAQRQEPRPRRGLIVGRYQMFHKGHLNTIRFMDQEPDLDEILIGIGSSQYDRNNKHIEMPWITNPFTFYERAEMIDSAIKGEVNKPYKIIPILDQHDHERWARYVIHIMPEFDYFYTNTKREHELFEKHGYEIRGIPIRDAFHAQTIREMIALGEKWQEFVPLGVVEFMKKVNGEKIMNDLFQEHGEEMIEAHNFYPDWEWRTFDEISPEDMKKIEELPTATEKAFSDTYLISPDHPNINMKKRGDILKVKNILKEEDGWELTATYSYKEPIRKKALDVLFKEIKYPDLNGLGDEVKLNTLINKLRSEMDLKTVQINKERTVKNYEACAIDVQAIRPPNRHAPYFTIGIESRSKPKIQQVIQELGLDKYKPQGYMGFIIDKVLGIKP